MTDPWVQGLADRIEQAETLRELYKLGPWEDRWCRSSLTGVVIAKAVDVQQIVDIASAGSRVEMRIDIERLRIEAIVENSREFLIETTGEWADAVDDEAAALSAADAAARGDLASVLAAIQEVETTLTVTILNKSAGMFWVRTARAFVDEFDRAGWFGFARLVAPKSGASNRVLVLDAGGAAVRAEGIMVHGPDLWPSVSPWTPLASTGHLPGDPRAVAPVPSALLPIESNGAELAGVATSLEATAGALAWLWLADTASIVEATVVVRVTGAKPIEGPLSACPTGLGAPSVELWSWSNVSTQPARRHAVVQAITLQADEPSDFFTRAASVLDTAEFLFSLAQSGLVQEALAARRAARDAAVAASRAAADRARAAARSAVDRVLVVIAAGVGVVLANKGDLIDRPVAYGLLSLAALLVAGSALLAFHFDLPGALRAVTVFKSELVHHAEVLSPRDVETITALPSLADGVGEVDRARKATIVIVLVSVAALVLLTTVVAGRPPSSGTRAPAPARATTPTPTSATTTATVPASPPRT